MSDYEIGDRVRLLPVRTARVGEVVGISGDMVTVDWGTWCEAVPGRDLCLVETETDRVEDA